MRSLRLVALSEDGTHLVLAAEGPDPSDDVEHLELAVDEHLRSLLAGRPAEPAAEPVHEAGPQPVPAQPANDLPPRVIQARHPRRGESRAGRRRLGHPRRADHAVRPPGAQERARVAEQARDARVRLSRGRRACRCRAVHGRAAAAARRRPRRRPVGRPPDRGRHLAGHRRLARRRQVRARPAGASTSPPRGHPLDAADDGLRRGHPAGPGRPRRAPAGLPARPLAPVRPGRRPRRPTPDAEDRATTSRSRHDVRRPPSDNPATRLLLRPTTAPTAGGTGRRRTSRSARTCPTRSPTTTPSSWARIGDGRDRRPAGPDPGVGGHRLRGPPAPLTGVNWVDELVRRSLPRIASEAMDTAPPPRAVGPGQALRAAPALALRPPLPRADRADLPRAPCWPRSPSSPSRWSPRPSSTGRSPTATVPGWSRCSAWRWCSGSPRRRCSSCAAGR